MKGNQQLELTSRFEMPAENDISEAKVRRSLKTGKFQEKVEDISVLRSAGVMTAEMAKFYFVVAGMNFTKKSMKVIQQFVTIYRKYERPCWAYWFRHFQKANNLTVDLAQMKALKGRITLNCRVPWSSRREMAQTVFTDIYYHPTVKGISIRLTLKTKRRNKRQKRYERYVEITGFRQYFFDKILWLVYWVQLSLS